MLAGIYGMAPKSTLPIPASIELNGLSEAQEKACYAAMQAFLERNQIASWRLKVNLTEDGPQTCRLNVSVVAPSEFDFQTRSTQVSVDKSVDLARVADLCLETHYNACMNAKAMSNRGAFEAYHHKAGSRY